MDIARKTCLVLSLTVIVLWLLAWLPVYLLPNIFHWFVYWFGGALTFLLVPAVVGVWWGVKKPSKLPVLGQSV